MDLLTGNSARVNRKRAPAAGLRIQSSAQGLPIPWLCGQQRLAVNYLWWGGFVAQQVKAGKGGKGGGGSYSYVVSVVFGLCEGPISGVSRRWSGKNVYTVAQFPNITVFDGAVGQAVWPFLEADFPPYAIGYSSTAYLGIADASLGSQPSFPNENYEVTGGIANAVSESYTVAAPYSFTAQYFSLAASVTEQVTVPPAPYQVQAQNWAPQTPLPVATNAVLDTAIVGTGSSGVIYQATGAPLRLVAANPGQGEYTVTQPVNGQGGGLYTFSAADAGQQLVIIDFAVAPGVAYAGGGALTQVLPPVPPAPTVVTGSFTPNSNIISYLSNTVGVGQEVIAADVPAGTRITGTGYSLTYGLSATMSANYTGAVAATGSITLPSTAPSGLQKGQFALTVTAGGYGQYQFSPQDAGAALVIVDVPDADPSAALTDYLTNPRYGVGFPSANLGSLALLQDYAFALGLFISPAETSARAASAFLQDFATALNGEFVWSAGLLTFVPYGDSTITGNGKTFTPPNNLAPLYDLDDDDFLKNEGTNTVGVSAFTRDDPVVCARKRLSDAYNDVKVEFLDRGNNYNPAIVEAQDDAAINVFGLRPADTRQLHLFCAEAPALMAAQLQLGRQQIRNRYSFTVPWYFILLDPMDVIAISDANLGLAEQLVRILEITENQQDWTLTITAEEVLAGAASAPVYGTQPRGGAMPNYNAAPGSINPPLFVALPAQLTAAGPLQYAIVLSGQNPSAWGGCDVYLSTDDDSYSLVGTVHGARPQGVLAAALPAGPDPDTTDTLLVDLALSGGALASYSQAAADAFQSLCVVDGELMAYETAALQSASTYALGYLRRGLYGTAIAAHAAGAPFGFLDQGYFAFALDPALAGKTVYFKFPSFNLYQAGNETLDGVPAWPVTIPYPAALPDVADLFYGGASQIAWSPVSADVTPIDYEIRIGSSWAQGQLVGRTALTSLAVSYGGTYWVAAHWVSNQGQDVYSATPVSVAVSLGAPSLGVLFDETEEESGWPGTLGGDAVINANALELSGAGNFLAEPDILADSDILWLGGVGPAGSYQFDLPSLAALGLVTTASVIFVPQMTFNGISIYDNVLDLANLLSATDLLDAAIGADVGATLQIALGSTGGMPNWQTLIPGAPYQADFGAAGATLAARVVLASSNGAVRAVVSHLALAVYAVDLIENAADVAIAAAGATIGFSQTFNKAPSIQLTILAAQPGDIAVVNPVTGAGGCTGFTVQVTNGGAGVARNINWLAKGY